jgi:hypothetical protein
MRTACAVLFASWRLRAAWISSQVSGRRSTRYLVVVVLLVAEDVAMLPGGLCATLLGVSGVAGRGSTVLVFVLVLALALVLALGLSVLWGLRRPLEFGRRLYPCAMIWCVGQGYERCSSGGELGAGALDGMRLFDSVCLASWLKYTQSHLTFICVNR